MLRVLSGAIALVLFVARGAALSAGAPPRSSDEAIGSAVAHLERAQLDLALVAFEKALDSYAAEQRLSEVRRAYMRMFVGNRRHASVLMKAMKTWVQKHRTDNGGLTATAFAEFDAWVQERDVLAAATVNLAHNSPDWK